MHWLALQWAPEAGAAAPVQALAADAPSRDTLAWWALGFTPHVVWLDEALLLEVSACERLWGGRRALIERVLQSNPAGVVMGYGLAATSLIALARLRCQPMSGILALDSMGQATPHPARSMRPADLPLHTLTAARAHLPVLARLGCRTWGQVDALPRGGLARRFGPALGRALDVAFGRAPDVHAWITLPDRFEQALELPQRADSAPALLWSARRLLQALQHWLAARQQGVLALELAWTFDQRRLDGRALPPQDAITLRTAEGVQHMDHIQRLLAERLARTPLLAPARAIRLRVLQTAPWNPATASFLPEDQPRGDALHVFVERVSARLGTGCVRVPVLHADHRPECRQGWQPAEQALSEVSPWWKRTQPKTVNAASDGPGSEAVDSLSRLRERAGMRASDGSDGHLCPSPPPSPQRGEGAKPSAPTGLPDALSPTWLLREPQPLRVEAGQPCHQGQRLRLIAGPHRLEAGWWSAALPEAGDEAVAARDYFIAQSPTAELLWVYRERRTASQPLPAVNPVPRTAGDAPATPIAGEHRRAKSASSSERWFLQGLYA
ncbi:Y-family DNA polymerase [Ottowia testudinis]|uniref:DNA polymerase Y family protein n=1 Tax=Ottowia testudinis TaxID=2816950 RepID=A0A975CJE8_9BURK|nr:DNA polymerase Y family protein [Ottowia testudinis]QTD46926.1 DNA polymerase Y family protein [Ottowia testudinis]